MASKTTIYRAYFLETIILIALGVSVVVGTTLKSEEQKSVFVLGTDFQRIKLQNNQELSQISELKEITNIEVFYWYGCEA